MVRFFPWFAMFVFIEFYSVTEAPDGFVMRRADDVAQDEIDIGDRQVSLEKCAHLCRKTYTNTCTAFSYNFKLGECTLKTRAMRKNDPVVDATKETAIFLRKNRPYSRMALQDLPNYDVESKDVSSIEECLEYCNEDWRCLTAAYDFQDDLCYKKFGAAVWYMTNATNIDIYTVAGPSDGPCPAGIRFRDLCIERSVGRALSMASARNYCRFIGGHLLRPFNYKKWSLTNHAGSWDGYWRIDLDSVGHDGTWKTETDKIYPEMWEWDTTWSGTNGPVGDPNCKYGVLKALVNERLRNETYYAGKLSCDNGTFPTEVFCEFRK